MESLNSRRRLHLSTICTTDPVHHLVFVEKQRRWSNMRIIQKQDEALEKTLRDGEKVVIDPDLGVALIVCAACGQGGHRAPSCPSKNGVRSGNEDEVEGQAGERKGARNEAVVAASGLNMDDAHEALAVVISIKEVDEPTN